jgi:hypothetical protein
MTRRPAVTLMEVLIAMFIMAIGMMALLALFPVGAASMAQALKDDRCAYASTVSDNIAIATNVRYGDLNVNAALAASPTGLLYVDPYGVLAAPTTPPYGVNLGGLIPRVSPTFVASSPLLIDSLYSLPDDIGFNQSGVAPDLSNTPPGIVDRGRRYSWAFLLRRTPPASLNPALTMYTVQLYAVVYSGRPLGAITAEQTYGAVGAIGTNSIVVSPTPGMLWPPNLKRGGWILDPTNGYFYRVTNISEILGSGNLLVETQQNLIAASVAITVMDGVAEVFNKGTGWQQ